VGHKTFGKRRKRFELTFDVLFIDDFAGNVANNAPPCMADISVIIALAYRKRTHRTKGSMSQRWPHGDAQHDAAGVNDNTESAVSSESADCLQGSPCADVPALSDSWTGQPHSGIAPLDQAQSSVVGHRVGGRGKKKQVATGGKHEGTPPFTQSSGSVSDVAIVNEETVDSKPVTIGKQTNKHSL